MTMPSTNDIPILPSHSPYSSPPVQRGLGRLQCVLDPVTGTSRCAHVFARYPVRLVVSRPLLLARPTLPSDEDLEPEHTPLHVEQVYMLSYGGGWVAGDGVILDPILVDVGASLCLRTPSATLIFKGLPDRKGHGGKTSSLVDGMSFQRMTLDVRSNTTCYVTPAPVCCFRDACFEQDICVNLQDATSSLLLLDWITSGGLGGNVAALRCSLAVHIL